jgi:hypothetical protein
MDPEEFQAWKDSPATQWVLKRANERARRIEDTLRDTLYGATGLTAQEWADLQGRAAYDRGSVAGIDFVTKLTFEEINDEPDGAEVG